MAGGTTALFSVTVPFGIHKVDKKISHQLSVIKHKVSTDISESFHLGAINLQ